MRRGISGTTPTSPASGSFPVADRAVRQGVNPATGEPSAIAATKAPRFSAGAKLNRPPTAGVWGISAHTCPYCDGFERRDERLAVLGSGPRGEHLAVLLRQWSEDVVLFSNGPHDLAVDQLARVHALGIPIIETPVAALEGDDHGRLRRVRLDSGETLDRDALFFYVGWRLRNDLARKLGCGLRDDGSIAVDAEQATTVDRVYAAGNCTEPRALVPTAAGAGVTAAVSVNVRLTFEDADHAVADAAAPGAKVR